jgi:alpha-D-xyloside xylohydrolase
VAYRGCGNFDAEKSLKLAQSLRDQHMPCDIWGLEPGWQQKAYSCSFTWNEQSFPDPDGFMKSIQSMGYRTSFWEHAFTHSSSPIHDALKPFSGDYLVWDGLVPDFATAGAQKIFEEHHEKVLFSKGADSVKLDECDNQPDSATPWSFPEAAEFPSGIDGERYHSLFGTLYQHTMMAPLQKRNRRTWGLVRNSHALAAPSPYVIYSDNYDFDCYVRGLANAGFSGLLWTPEVRDAGSVEELCRRVATVVMSPYAMINAWYIPMPPWVQINREKNGAGEAMPEQDEATNAVRSLLRLRMSLVPYLYSAFNDYAKSGTPPVRAIVMDWPDDDEARKIDDQFLVGPSLLVAPMFPGQSSRSVYLPSGKWYDFWTGDAITGPAHLANVSCPLDRVPVYVRDNALLPLADPVEHIAPDTVFSLTVRVYGEIPKPFALFADDGVSNDYKNDIQDQLTLSWAAGTGHVASSGKYRGPARYQVAQWTKV